mgnify:CR=1 FL=1
MANFSSLEIAKKGLLANRFGIDVTSNNIANVNTPGYSRRQATFAESNPLYTNSGFIGTGVLSEKLRTFREEYVDKEVRTSLAKQSGYEIDEQMFGRIEAILAEPSDNGLNELTAKFFSSFEALSTKPEDLGLRQNVLTIAGTLVDRFHTVSEHLQSMRVETGSNIQSNIDEANSIIKQISDLNRKIAGSKSIAGNEAQTLVDKREALIEGLTKIVGVTVHPVDNGEVNVYINGISIITDGIPSELKAVESIDAATGEKTMQIAKLDSKGNALSVVLPNSGEISSLLKHFNTTLDSNDSSGGFSIFGQIDDFAQALTQKVNAITIDGYGLDDTGALPPGRTFFEPSVGPVTAATIEISPDVLNRPRDIPISDSPNEPGNNELALDIGRLALDTDFLNGYTPSEYYTGFIGKLGSLASEANYGLESSKLVSDQLLKQRESVIGVNLDEEAVNLIKFQRAFEASSRVINVTNEMLATLVNLGT